MKTQRFLTSLVLLAALLVVMAGLSQAQAPEPENAAVPAEAAAAPAAIGTAFTYQGQLKSGGNPASGSHDFQFILYNASSGGAQVGSIVTRYYVPVTNGLFTVALDFGTVFDGTRLWLEIAVRPSGATGYTILSPRQELTPAPYALYAQYAANVPAHTHTHDHFGETWSGSAIYGLRSVNTAPGGFGVYGEASATSGGRNYGIYGQSASLDGYGGYFKNTNGGVDIFAAGSGKIKSVADTQIVVSSFNLMSWGDVTAIPNDEGHTYLRSRATGSQQVPLPVTLPSQIFGVPQKLKSIKVCYMVDNAASYINKTEAYYKDGNTGERTFILTDDTNRASTSSTCYTSTASTPQPIQGGLVVRFWLNYAGTDWPHDIIMGSVTLTLTEN